MKKRFNKINVIITFIATIITIITFLMIFVPKKSNNLSGKWIMISKIIQADKKDYIGAKVEWKMFLSESDEKLKGTAEKIKINGIELNYNQRTSMSLEGIIEKNKIILNFIEAGKIRETSGIIEATFEKDKYYGTFSQTASNAEGTIQAYKIK